MWFWVYWLPVGFLLVNGAPHLLAGCAGIPFKSPFGRPSRPRTNVLWGGANFVTVTLIVSVHLVLDTPSRQDLVGLLIGAWAAGAFFVLRAKTFFFPPQQDHAARTSPRPQP